MLEPGAGNSRWGHLPRFNSAPGRGPEGLEFTPNSVLELLHAPFDQIPSALGRPQSIRHRKSFKFPVPPSRRSHSITGPGDGSRTTVNGAVPFRCGPFEVVASNGLRCFSQRGREECSNGRWDPAPHRRASTYLVDSTA